MTHWVRHRRSQEETFRKWTHPPPTRLLFQGVHLTTSPSSWTGRQEGGVEQREQGSLEG